MSDQQEEFAAIFSTAHPYLSVEQRRMLAAMAELWASRKREKPSLRLVTSGSSVRNGLGSQLGSIDDALPPLVSGLHE